MAVWTDPEILPGTALNHDLPERLLWTRGVRTQAEIAAFLDAAIYQGPPVEELPGLAQAVPVLLEAQRLGRRIFVWGDFDVDGQSATALLVSGFRRLGLDTHYYMPDRLEQGHGLNTDGLQDICEQGGELVVTCDCGVGDHEQLMIAQELGLEVIVSDHHVIDKELKPVKALVHPHLLPPEHPFYNLCGVGVAFLLFKALHHALKASFDVDEYLDLVALGTVADRATLLHENRYMVQCGLQRIFYAPRPGLAALMHITRTTSPSLLDTNLINFTLAPRLNAVGRLQKANLAVELLLTESMDQATIWATELESINRTRKILCREAEEEAEKLLVKYYGREQIPLILLISTKWHPGVLGIIATRLAQRYSCPALLVRIWDDGVVRGSARSVPGIDIHSLLQDQSALLNSLGGHAMAAGFTLALENVPILEKAITAILKKTLDTDSNVDNFPELILDAYVELADITLDFLRQIYRLAPFGDGNPKPIIATRQVRLVNKSEGWHQTKLLVENDLGQQQRAIWWNTKIKDIPNVLVDVAFHLGLDERWGTDQIQLEIVAVRPSAEAVRLGNTPFCHIIDQRDVVNRIHSLAEICSKRGSEVQIWAENEVGVEGGLVRDQLVQGKDLIVFTTPPSAQIWTDVIKYISPQVVYLLTSPTEILKTDTFVDKLELEAVRISKKENPCISLEHLAGCLGARETTIIAGLTYLVRRGRLHFNQRGEDLFIKSVRKPCRRTPKSGSIRQLLEETDAFKRYFAEVRSEDLLLGI